MVIFPNFEPYIADFLRVCKPNHSFCRWISILLIAFITSITTAIATLLMSPLGVTGVTSEMSQWQFTEQVMLLAQLLKSFFCWGHPLVSINMGHKYLSTLCLFVEVYPYTLCVVYFSIVAGTSYHTFTGLNYTHLMSYSVWGRKSEMCLSRLVFLVVIYGL